MTAPARWSSLRMSSRMAVISARSGEGSCMKSAAASALRRIAPSGWLISCASAEASWPITDTRPTWAMSWRRRSVSCSACLREVMSMQAPRLRSGRPRESNSTRPIAAIQRMRPSASGSLNSTCCSPRSRIARAVLSPNAARSSTWIFCSSAPRFSGSSGAKPNSSRHSSLATITSRGMSRVKVPRFAASAASAASCSFSLSSTTSCLARSRSVLSAYAMTTTMPRQNRVSV